MPNSTNAARSQMKCPDRSENLVRSLYETREALHREKCKYGDAKTLNEKFCFILLDDFKARIWGAEIISGKFKGVSISKLTANLLQTLGKAAPNSRQNELREIFFPKFKSPQKTITSANPAILEIS